MKKLLLILAIVLAICFSEVEAPVYAENNTPESKEAITVHKELEIANRSLEQLRKQNEELTQALEAFKAQMRLRDFIVVYAGQFDGIDGAEAMEIGNVAIRNGNLFDMDPLLIVAMIRQESVFKKKLVMKDTKATGLMQLLPSTAKLVAKSLGETYEYDKLFDADTNVRWGTRYLKDNFDTYGKKKNGFFLSIKAYFTGPNYLYNPSHDWYAESVIKIYEGLKVKYKDYTENVTP